MYQSMSHYLEDTNQLSDTQHGYRKHRSTQSAVLQVTYLLRMNGDKKRYTGLVFIDFKKAFDCLNHELLLKKLENLGVTKINLEWYRSYFSNRNISVKNGHAISSSQPLTEGTPQGSSLCGLLFSIYINEVANLFDNCNAVFYADDLVLFCSSCTLVLI
jgi:retron-type reverse transcriptase